MEKIITLDHNNIDTEHICCAIGNDKKNQGRAQIKKTWLKQTFSDGFKFKKFNLRGKVFIEYVPAENAWSPVEAPGYMFIHCFWVSGRYKGQGYGSKLLEECIRESKNKNGVVVISTSKKKPFIADKKFFLKKGFIVCDTAPPYFELLVKQFTDAPLPKFKENAKTGICDNKTGLTFHYSDQCPFNEDFVNEMADAGKNYKIPTKIIKIETKEQAQNISSPISIFSVFYNGNFLSSELMTQKKFDQLLQKTIT